MTWRRPSFALPAVAAVTFVGVYAMTPPAHSGGAQADGPIFPTYYRNCDAARTAGAAPINAGEPGYRSGLDADSDGIACEPFHSRY